MAPTISVRPQASEFPKNKIHILISWVFCQSLSSVGSLYFLILSFTYGLILAPFGSGLFFLVVSILAYEWLIYVFAHGRYGPPATFWEGDLRAGVILASILGWIIGRTVSGYEILPSGVPL